MYQSRECVALYTVTKKGTGQITHKGVISQEVKNATLFGFAYTDIRSESFILEGAGYFLSALYKQESSGKRKPQLRNCLK